MFDQRRYRILAVVADAATRRGLEKAVEGTDWTVEFVYQVQEALSRLREELAPVVICEAEGVGEWRELLGDGTGLPFVVVTSRLPDEELWLEVLRAGGYDVLGLPVEKRELGRVLQVAGSHWRHRRMRAGSLAAAS